jgi:predicted metal-dependent peptidase
MSDENIITVVSQLKSLDTLAEGVIIPADAQVYWDQVTKVKNCSPEELAKIKVVGRGGTHFMEFIEEYEERIGKQDFVIIMTDGYLFEDLNKIKVPKQDIVWVIVNNASFTAPFGRVFHV